MTIPQQVITISLCILGTVTTRFLPFLIFSDDNETPAFIHYISRYLPSAIFGMLVIYCLRNVSLLRGSHGLPEFISIAVTAAVHLRKRRMLLSIAAGTICYMLMIRCF